MRKASSYGEDNSSYTEAGFLDAAASSACSGFSAAFPGGGLASSYPSRI